MHAITQNEMCHKDYTEIMRSLHERTNYSSNEKLIFIQYPVS